jgi:hypothetical protein
VLESIDPVLQKVRLNLAKEVVSKSPSPDNFIELHKKIVDYLFKETSEVKIEPSEWINDKSRLWLVDILKVDASGSLTVLIEDGAHQSSTIQ